MPELTARGADGEIETVKYHLLPTLRLAEVQRLERERSAAQAEAATLADRVEALEQMVRKLERAAARR